MVKILIVDDEQNIRAVLREYAEFEGYQCDEAEDGMEAVKLARENTYDVIIMDVMMPKLDGYYAVKEIRKFSSVPIVMLSARVEEYDRLFGFEVGVDDYVTKPFSPKEVMMRIGARREPRNCGQPRKTSVQRLGLRLLRRRQDGGHSHQDASLVAGQIPRQNRYVARTRLQNRTLIWKRKNRDRAL